MIPARAFVQALKTQGVRCVTGVPCAFFQSVIECIMADSELRYVKVPNEGAALAVASGAHLAGARTAILVQNAGVGNLVNPLTSLNMVYRLPVLLLISGRAYGVPDEPQHLVMGRVMKPMMEMLGVPGQDLPMDAPSCEAALHDAIRRMEQERLPAVFFVRKGTFEPSAGGRREADVKYALTRAEAIRVIAETLEGHECVVATTGKPSRELFSVFDRSANFYMQGSMGHAAAIGLGVSLAQPKKTVVVLDGDGAVLMHMGTLSSIGHHRPRNLCHIVLDNESYESTGDQDTTSSTTDLCAVAAACGYRRTEEAMTAGAVRAALQRLLGGEGPAFLRVKVNRVPTPNIPRITTKHTPEQIAETFHAQLVRSDA